MGGLLLLVKHYWRNKLYIDTGHVKFQKFKSRAPCHGHHKIDRPPSATSSSFDHDTNFFWFHFVAHPPRHWCFTKAAFPNNPVSLKPCPSNPFGGISNKINLKLQNCNFPSQRSSSMWISGVELLSLPNSVNLKAIDVHLAVGMLFPQKIIISSPQIPIPKSSSKPSHVSWENHLYSCIFLGVLADFPLPGCQENTSGVPRSSMSSQFSNKPIPV